MAAHSGYYDFFIDRETDIEMGDGHLPLWNTMIDHMVESSLSDKTVLDFGCNVGGFLHLLYERKPYRLGIGVDVAEGAIRLAQSQNGSHPIRFEATDSVAHMQDEVNVAFSHEVLYLIGNLYEHAREMYNALQPGGAYYAATGCHADHPLWARWRDLFQRETPQPVYDITLNDIANAFSFAGFKLSAQRFRYSGFVNIEADRRLFPTINDALDYYNDYKILWRFVKP